MTQATTLPDLAFWQQQLGRDFLLSDDAGNCVTVKLSQAETGVAMGEGYRCYSAIFVCPQGVQVGQATFRLQLDDQQWDIFMTPIGPDQQGCACLEAVFHVQRDSARTTA